jgi:hypothetical protein
MVDFRRGTSVSGNRKMKRPREIMGWWFWAVPSLELNLEWRLGSALACSTGPVG